MPFPRLFGAAAMVLAAENMFFLTFSAMWLEMYVMMLAVLMRWTGMWTPRRKKPKSRRKKDR